MGIVPDNVVLNLLNFRLKVEQKFKWLSQFKWLSKRQKEVRNSSSYSAQLYLLAFVLHPVRRDVKHVSDLWFQVKAQIYGSKLRQRYTAFGTMKFQVPLQKKIPFILIIPSLSTVEGKKTKAAHMPFSMPSPPKFQHHHVLPAQMWTLNRREKATTHPLPAHKQLLSSGGHSLTCFNSKQEKLFDKLSVQKLCKPDRSREKKTPLKETYQTNTVFSAV